MKVKLYKIYNYIFFIWLLGLDQFFFTPFFAFISALKSNKLKIELPAFFILIIIFCMILSSINIESTIKFFQISRNIFSLLGAFFIINYFSQYGKKINTNNRFISTLAFSSFIIVLCGFMPLIGINFSYKAIFYHLFSFLDIGMLNQFFTKTFADENAGNFFSSYAIGFVRPRGLMLFPNQLAQICLISIGSSFYLFTFKDSKIFKSNNFILITMILISTIVLLSTLSRGSWLAFTFAISLIMFFEIFDKKKVSIVYIISILFLISILYLFSAFDLVFSRFDNAHSDVGRMTNYTNSIKMVLSSPYRLFLGFGSQIDFSTAEANVKLGSHSAYIGILFKYGIFAFLSYCSLQFFLFYKTIKAFLKQRLDKNTFYFFLFNLTVFSITPIFYEVDVDMINILFVFTLYGLIYSSVK